MTCAHLFWDKSVYTRFRTFDYTYWLCCIYCILNKKTNIYTILRWCVDLLIFTKFVASWENLWNYFLNFTFDVYLCSMFCSLQIILLCINKSSSERDNKCSACFAKAESSSFNANEKSVGFKGLNILFSELLSHVIH